LPGLCGNMDIQESQLLNGFDMEIINKKAAIEQGKKLYFTGLSCKRGHIAERRVSNNTCCECDREIGRKSYKNNSSKRIARVKQYRAENLDSIKDKKAQKYAELSYEQKISRSEKRRIRLETDLEYRDKTYAKAKEWRENNTEQVRSSKSNYTAIKRTATKSKITKSDIELLFDEQNISCFYCGADLGEYHIDHIHPLSKGGEHKVENLCITCPRCNLRKHSREPLKFFELLLTNGEIPFIPEKSLLKIESIILCN
jgi:5-methylcytosine-specific restriction endonuclease McrA